MKFEGIYTPAVTPLDADGAIDRKAYAEVLEALRAGGVHGIIIAGSTGEYYAHTPQERTDLAAYAKQVIGSRLPLIVGTGRESTKATIEATSRAAALGADAALVRTPSFFKNAMTSEVFIRHYSEVADASRIPVLLYNVTMYTGVTLQADAVEQLSAHPNIVGVFSGQIEDAHRFGFAIGDRPTQCSTGRQQQHECGLARAGLPGE